MMFQESTRRTGKTWKLYQKIVQHKNVHLTLSQKKPGKFPQIQQQPHSQQLLPKIVQIKFSGGKTSNYRIKENSFEEEIDITDLFPSFLVEIVNFQENKV